MPERNQSKMNQAEHNKAKQSLMEENGTNGMAQSKIHETKQSTPKKQIYAKRRKMEQLRAEQQKGTKRRRRTNQN